MLGAIVGDIIGSRVEGRKSILNEENMIIATVKNELRTSFTKPEKIIHSKLSFTDDTVLTIATSKALRTHASFEKMYINFFGIHSEQNNLYKGPGIGYGQMFMTWAMSNLNGVHKGAYGSYGNGAPMRVSPVPFFAENLVETLNQAKESSICTHNHPFAVKGSQAIAACIYLSRSGVSVCDIKKFLASNFDYDLELDEQSLIMHHTFSPLSETTVPIAIWAALKGPTFEAVMIRCLKIGGDTDTIAAMAGSIAEHLYGVPKYMEYCALEILKRDGPFLYEEYLEFSNLFYSNKESNKEKETKKNNFLSYFAWFLPK